MNEQEQPKSGGWAAASMVVLIVDVIGFVILAAFTLRTKTSYEKMFIEFGVALPPITTFLVSMPSLLYVLLFGLLIAALVLKERYMAKKALTFAANVLAAVGGLAYLSFYVNAMLNPFLQMVQQMSKGH